LVPRGQKKTYGGRRGKGVWHYQWGEPKPELAVEKGFEVPWIAGEVSAKEIRRMGRMKRLHRRGARSSTVKREGKDKKAYRWRLGSTFRGGLQQQEKWRHKRVVVDSDAPAEKNDDEG